MITKIISALQAKQIGNTFSATDLAEELKANVFCVNQALGRLMANGIVSRRGEHWLIKRLTVPNAEIQRIINQDKL